MTDSKKKKNKNEKNKERSERHTCCIQIIDIHTNGTHGGWWRSQIVITNNIANNEENEWIFNVSRNLVEIQLETAQ